jgi:hypothetical protein
MSIFMKIRIVGAVLFHADGETDRYEAKMAVFRNVADVHKNDFNSLIFDVTTTMEMKVIALWCDTA